jgi:hypothetical protein
MPGKDVNGQPFIFQDARGEKPDRMVPYSVCYLLDDRPEEAILSLETGFIFGYKLIEIMEEYTVEQGEFRMSRTVNFCHGRSS